MTDLERQQATQTIVTWLLEVGGEKLADFWLWSATPFPCGLPFDDQLEDGLHLATGELSIQELNAKIEAAYARL